MTEHKASMSAESRSAVYLIESPACVHISGIFLDNGEGPFPPNIIPEC